MPEHIRRALEARARTRSPLDIRFNHQGVGERCAMAREVSASGRAVQIHPRLCSLPTWWRPLLSSLRVFTRESDGVVVMTHATHRFNTQ